jgi:hypothetical protein
MSDGNNRDDADYYQTSMCNISVSFLLAPMLSVEIDGRSYETDLPARLQTARRLHHNKVDVY